MSTPLSLHEGIKRLTSFLRFPTLVFFTVSAIWHQLLCGVLCPGSPDGEWRVQGCYSSLHGGRIHPSLQSPEHCHCYWVGPSLKLPERISSSFVDQFIQIKHLFWPVEVDNQYGLADSFLTEAMEEPTSAAHLLTLVPEMEMQWWPGPVSPARTWSSCSSTPQVRKMFHAKLLSQIFQHWQEQVTTITQLVCIETPGSC